ncbi:MAG: hypothetical protein KDK99_08205 [Verrucomicrobiales bacterium]|nr:hypothetical protein [Verrucomicrobiales bacterium]
MKFCQLCLLLLLVVVAPAPAAAQVSPAKGEAKAKAKGRAKAGPASRPPQVLAKLLDRASTSDAVIHRDFPDLAITRDGAIWVAFIEHEKDADRLILARRRGAELERVAVVSNPGMLHQPALAADGEGGLWCLWAQVNEDNVMTLRARHFADGKLGAEEEVAASPDAGHSFVDAATAPGGGVWAVWQRVSPGASRIQARRVDARGQWSETITLPNESGGSWEPRIAILGDEAWVVYDNSAGSEFNLRLARITLDGAVEDRSLVATPDYEARASICADANGGLWIAAERGRQQWGLDARGHENEMGFNASKRLVLGRYDVASGIFTEVPVPDRGRPTPAPEPSPGFAVNLPSVHCSHGEVWLAYRYFSNVFWRAAVCRYDPVTAAWKEPVALPDSTMGQDRHQEWAESASGDLWLAWPSDLRTSKACRTASVFAARLDPQASAPNLPAAGEIARAAAPKPYLNEPTPPRSLDDHHTWTIGGKTYHLLWGDLHRHTDISNCRTGFDGCVVEAYRYAYDLAGLDFLGTSDHTDIAKKYDPYEWWHTQRQVDVFFAPGHFTSLYAYEREQRFPWGHRNLVFAQRGAPIVYINRALYRASPYQADLPVKAGIGEIHPTEVWDLLHRYGKPCAIISHTGATGMGTDWTAYPDGIDNERENLVEIFQGARVSYEGLGLPQPTVGLRVGEPYTPHRLAGDEHPKPPAPIVDFDAGFAKHPGYNNGVYQKALAVGHKLGVFACSDHISTHTSFGGVYVEEITREGIIAGFTARRTCAATDKIFIQLSSGDHLMGEVFSHTKGEPIALDIHIEGTAPLTRVTVVRNEIDLHVIQPAAKGHSVDLQWTDAAPLAGENRYYLRIEQADGNMGWSSPLWIKVP